MAGGGACPSGGDDAERSGRAEGGGGVESGGGAEGSLSLREGGTGRGGGGRTATIARNGALWPQIHHSGPC
jgi:hypothetical protein